MGAGALTSHRRSRIIERALRTRAAGSDIGAIDHVVFVMQENRSFDHYFGTYPGVRGFNDHPSGSYGDFAQPYPENTTALPTGVLLPFHLDTSTGIGACTTDLTHDWLPQHLSWNGGAMDGFVSTHTMEQYDGSAGLLTMGYYERSDLPYHFALADAFTICDGYHCSVLGPTHPNRLMALTGTIDPAGRHGGPVISTEVPAQALFSVSWTTVPELLSDHGVSWKTYTPPGQGYVASDPAAGFGDAILPYFKQYQNPRSDLHRRAFLPTFPGDFAHDVKTGTLPSVSWLVSPNGYDEHPPAPAAYGAWYLSRVLAILTSNPVVWSKTALIITYDENDGFFDHVPPPTAPRGTAGEYLTSSTLPSGAGSVAGPIGLGFRVPALVVSPFSRGGHVVSDTYDHTSQLRLLEERFGIRVDNLSPWRRSVVGDLTATLTAKPVYGPPRLPSTSTYRVLATTLEGCTAEDISETATSQPPYPLPTVQSMPTQEA